MSNNTGAGVTASPTKPKSIMAQLTTEQLNKKLEVKSLAGLVFANGNKQHKYASNTYGLYVHGYGWLAFKADGQMPYTPLGGKSTLEQIQHKGLLHYKDVQWVKPIKEAAL